LEETQIDRVGGCTARRSMRLNRRCQASLGIAWDLGFDLLTPYKLSDRAPQPVLVVFFDPPLERVAMRLDSDSPVITRIENRVT
jgi:hypothetical protein